ncbi:hypothetical protein R6Q59_020580 [Mikania micrantha]
MGLKRPFSDVNEKEKEKEKEGDDSESSDRGPGGYGSSRSQRRSSVHSKSTMTKDQGSILASPSYFHVA